MQLLKNHKFGSDFSDKYISKYNNTLRLIQSKDKRQRQRGIDQLKYITIDMNAQLEKLQKEIDLLIAETNLSAFPKALSIKSNLEVLCKNFFEDDYFDNRISKEILDVTREIIRDQVTEKKGLHKILLQFFNTLDVAHTREKKELFQAIENYKDTLGVLEVYEDSIYREIKETNDVEKIQSRIQELQTKIQEFQIRKDALVKNSIAFH